MNFLKSFAAHLSMYVSAAYTIGSAIDPATLPPQYAPYILGALGLLSAVHHITVAPTVPSTGLPPPSKETIVKLHVLTILAVVLMLVSCATITSPSAQPVITAAVDIAVATAEQKGVTAAQINSIAKQALIADSGVTSTVVAVAGVVNVELAKLNLPPAELAAAQILEDALAVAIQAQIGANPQVAVAQAAIAEVCQAAIAATGG